MPQTTITIPTVKGTATATGRVARFTIGGKSVRFLLQDNGGEDFSLTHYASGYKLADLNGKKVAAYVGNGSLITNREAARRWIDDAVASIGADAFLGRLSSVPVLNK